MFSYNAMSYRRLIEASEESPLTDDYDESNENIKEFECHVSYFLFVHFPRKKEKVCVHFSHYGYCLAQ